jgi:pimeloyl-ACP methyl ester carboxylesterase
MAAKSSDVAFVVNISGPGVSPFEQTMYQRGVDLSERKIPPRQVTEAMNIRRAILSYFATGQGADAAQAAWRGARDRPWFRVARETDRWFEALATLKSLPPPAALPADVVATLRRTYNYDPAAVAARVRVPVLNLFGGKDRHIPVGASVAALKAAYRRSGNRDAIVRVIPEGGHTIQVVDGPAECLRCMEERARKGALIQLPVAGYYDLILGWVEERFGPPDARVRHG